MTTILDFSFYDLHYDLHDTDLSIHYVFCAENYFVTSTVYTA